MQPSAAPGSVSLDEARKYLSAEEFAELERELTKLARGRLFFPLPKQRMVLESTADVIGYGGAAGGGKSYLLCGTALTQHQRSAIVRPQKNQCLKFVNELSKILGGRDGYSSQNSEWQLKTPDNVERTIHFFGLDNPGDEEKQQGDDYDLKAYDEATQMREQDVRYTLTWNRSADPKQRVRAILTFNPPTTPEGRWVIKFFAPWLDKSHPNPAKDGELRWFATLGANQDYEVKGPEPFVIKRSAETGELYPCYDFDPADHAVEDVVRPKSRTFIHARVTDNPYYMESGYLSQLQALPEPLRTQMMKGDFDVGIQDEPNQVIPSSWILAAQERWHLRRQAFDAQVAKLPPMDGMGVDVARGGNMGGTDDLANLGGRNDELVIQPRHGTFFPEQVIHKGVEINNGAKAATLILQQRRDDAPIHIDVVGVGTSPYDFLVENHIHTIAVNGTAASRGLDKSGLLRFVNIRAELHWRMREALDPANPEPIALPPDPQLAGDLAAPRWWLTKSGIQIEPKDDIKKRLGRSPDRGEAAIFANIDTPKREVSVGGYAGLPAHARESYEERRLRELE
jgi:hypothetical protein